MSTLVVEVCEVKAVYPHPNADALEFITVKGWPVIVQKSLGLKVGDRVVYFPPDSVMPPELAERLGITKYLAQLPAEIDGSRKPGLRVRAARLRGEAELRDDRSPGRPGLGGRAGRQGPLRRHQVRAARPAHRRRRRCRPWRRSTATPRSRTSATSRTCSGPARRSSSPRSSTARTAGWG